MFHGSRLSCIAAEPRTALAKTGLLVDVSRKGVGPPTDSVYKFSSRDIRRSHGLKGNGHKRVHFSLSSVCFNSFLAAAATAAAPADVLDDLTLLAARVWVTATSQVMHIPSDHGI